MASVKRETFCVKTFKAKRNDTYKYLQCENAYNPELPHCHNTIKDGDEYLTVLYEFDDGCKMLYDFCEGCMRAKLSEEEIEKLREAKGTKTKTKAVSVQALVNEIRSMLTAYDGHDLKGLEAMENALDEIVRITKGK